MNWTRSAYGGGLAVFRRRLIFMALTLSLSLLAMVTSYFMVRWLTLGMEQEAVLDPMVQRRAILLRGFANDLSTYCNDYVRVVDDPDSVPQDARNWIDRVYRRDLRFLEQRMADNAMPSLPPFLALQAATGRCATMARHPEDATLRRGALRDARSAIEGITGYLADAGMARFAGSPARLLRFD